MVYEYILALVAVIGLILFIFKLTKEDMVELNDNYEVSHEEEKIRKELSKKMNEEADNQILNIIKKYSDVPHNDTETKEVEIIVSNEASSDTDGSLKIKELKSYGWYRSISFANDVYVYTSQHDKLEPAVVKFIIDKHFGNIEFSCSTDAVFKDDILELLEKGSPIYKPAMKGVVDKLNNANSHAVKLARALRIVKAEIGETISKVVTMDESSFVEKPWVSIYSENIESGKIKILYRSEEYRYMMYGKNGDIDKDVSFTVQNDGVIRFKEPSNKKLYHDVKRILDLISNKLDIDDMILHLKNTKFVDGYTIIVEKDIQHNVENKQKREEVFEEIITNKDKTFICDIVSTRESSEDVTIYKIKKQSINYDKVDFCIVINDRLMLGKKIRDNKILFFAYPSDRDVIINAFNNTYLHHTIITTINIEEFGNPTITLENILQTDLPYVIGNYLVVVDVNDLDVCEPVKTDFSFIRYIANVRKENNTVIVYTANVRKQNNTVILELLNKKGKPLKNHEQWYCIVSRGNVLRATRVIVKNKKHTVTARYRGMRNKEVENIARSFDIPILLKELPRSKVEIIR